RFRNKVREKRVQVEESWPDAVQAECDKLQAQLSRSEKRADAASKTIDNHNKYRAELDSSKKSIEQKEKYATAMADELEKLRIEAKPQPRVTQNDEPYIVAGLEGNRRLKFALLAALGLFGAGFGGLVFWEARGRRVTHPNEAAAGVGARLLGTI